MISLSRVAKVIMIASVAMAGACSRSNAVRWEIAGHVFKIPRQFLVESSVFYLPGSEKKSLRFLINPDAPLQQQNMVSIHQNATCPPTGATDRNQNCKITAIPLDTLENAKIERVGNDSWWDYRFQNGGQLVAACYALNEGEGLCTHYGLYRGIPYELSLRDSQVSELITLRKRVEQRLSEWELR